MFKHNGMYDDRTIISDIFLHTHTNEYLFSDYYLLPSDGFFVGTNNAYDFLWNRYPQIHILVPSYLIADIAW